MRFVLDKKQRVNKHVLTEEKLDEVGERLEHTLQKSLRRLAQETEILMTSVRRATKLLKLKPYKLTGMHELLQHDHTERFNFCNWILQNVHDGIIEGVGI